MLSQSRKKGENNMYFIFTILLVAQKDETFLEVLQRKAKIKIHVIFYFTLGLGLGLFYFTILL